MWIIYHIFKKNARIYPHRTKAELLQLTMWVKEKRGCSLPTAPDLLFTLPKPTA